MIDLHLHSTRSDGMSTPSELVRGAKQRGIQAIALTDHDTVDGCPELGRAADDLGLDVLYGVELSSRFSDGALHFLGYGVDIHSRVLKEHLQWLQQSRDARNEHTVAKLNQLGLRLRMDEVESAAAGGVIGRPHMGKALVNRGYVASVKDAFSLYLNRSRPAYVARRTLDPEACIELIHQAGGLAVAAHPFTVDLPDRKLLNLLKSLKDAGLDGLEVFYRYHDHKRRKQFSHWADRLGLLKTGGSDFHGAPSEIGLLGTLQDGLPIDGEWAQQFLEAQATA